MEDINKEESINVRLKKAYGVDGLCFYMKNGYYHCKYSRDEDEVGSSDLDFLLKALSIQQLKIFFDDINYCCIGMDELKKEYLMFRLSGL